MPLVWVKPAKVRPAPSRLDSSRPIVGEPIPKVVSWCRANVTYEGLEPKIEMDDSPECKEQAKEMEKLPKNIRKLMKKITQT